MKKLLAIGFVMLAVVAYLAYDMGAETEGRTVYRLSWFRGMSFPRDSFDAITGEVRAYLAEHGTLPSLDQLRLRTQCRIDEFHPQGTNYQIALWSGETWWIYDAQSDSYHETIERNNGSWFVVAEQRKGRSAP